MSSKLLSVITGILISLSISGQKVTYSEPDKDDLKQTKFEIIGKVGSNLLIYKELRDNHAISIYNPDMKEVEKVQMDFLPDKLINFDFLAYNDFCYMFYQ